MSDAFVYDSPENHVEQRSGVSPSMREKLFRIPREEWLGYPRFKGEPEFWLEIHKGLLGASDALARMTREFLEDKDPQMRMQSASRISALGHQLLQHAHGHHHIEDHYFFPVFMKAFPQLQHPLEMLDGDHTMLGKVLDDLQAAVDGFPVLRGEDGIERDQMMQRAEILLPAATRLDALFIRHIGDEEEICVPAMLKM